LNGAGDALSLSGGHSSTSIISYRLELEAHRRHYILRFFAQEARKIVTTYRYQTLNSERVPIFEIQEGQSFA